MRECILPEYTRAALVALRALTNTAHWGLLPCTPQSLRDCSPKTGEQLQEYTRANIKHHRNKQRL